MVLEYLCEYRTYSHISRSYRTSESAYYRVIYAWVEDTLIEDGRFSLPRRNALLKGCAEYDVVLIDATEAAIEKPKKQRRFYSGKKR